MTYNVFGGTLSLTQSVNQSRPAVTFSVSGHQHRLTSTKLFYQVTEAQICEQLQGCGTVLERESDL